MEILPWFGMAATRGGLCAAYFSYLCRMGRLRIFAACAAVAAMPSCRSGMPVQSMAGLVGETTETALSVRNMAGDSVRRFVVDENTVFEGGDAVEGNAVEVLYRASRRGDELLALEVTADETYPAVLGSWATDARAELPVELELLPRGVLRQTAPPALLRFDGWYVDASARGRIFITGEVVIAADSVERYPFTARAELHEDKQGDRLVVEGASGTVVSLHRVE